jgi:hypothetical protein
MAGVRIRRGSVLLDLGPVRAIRPLWIALLLLLPAVAQAQFTFTTNNGAITITGYTGTNSVVVIPSATNGWPVTSIAGFAFFNCTSLTSVSIGNRVTTIGNSAFANCTSLANITLSTNVTSIGTRAFSNCTGLTTVAIPYSIISIGRSPFSFCRGLSAITVDPLNSLYGSLDGVLFNKNLTTLIQYPAGLGGNGYTIPNSVTSIGDEAFWGCISLTSVTIPDSVTSVGADAFYFCNSLTSVMIPDSVADIGWCAFAWCDGLTEITVDALNANYRSLDGVLFNQDQTTLIQCPAGKGGSNYTVPGSVTTIGDHAFRGCGMSGITIPGSVTSIKDNAFLECYSLTNITIPGSVTSLGAGAFFYCTSLAGVYFQGNAPSFDSSVFYNANNATVYYLPGTTGWEHWIAPPPAMLWNPRFQVGDASFGVQTNCFGFNITGTTNIPVVLEACTNLSSLAWVPLQNCTLTNGSFYFTDSNWTNYPDRFYRLRSP